MGSRLDDQDLDEKIISVLERDARVSNREIARTLGVSEGFIRKRLRHLLDTRKLRFGTLVSATAVGLNCTAFLRFRVAPEAVSAVAGKLAELNEVRFVGLAVGRYDVYALTLTTDRDAMFRLLRERIDQLPGVTFIDVREIMGVLKYEPNQIRIH